MGFLDKAKAAANELAQKADTALAGSGLGGPGASADRYLRDLGAITYLQAAGRPVPEADRERVLAALRDLEQRGELGALTLQTTAAQATAVPPPPGAAGQAPPPPTAAAPSPPQAPPTTSAPPPPPPPPSWAKDDEAQPPAGG
ncbi:MAG TPA: hypothetical protein VFV40_06800 [Nocardioides sp.]|nr:hypothetical protein [Nocardioides sp.]